MKTANSVFAGLFLGFLLAMVALHAYGIHCSGGTLKSEYESQLSDDAPISEKISFVLENSESAFNEDLDYNHWFIQLYGGIQRLAGRRYVDDSSGYPVAKLSNGQLTFAVITEFEDPTENALATVSFAQRLEQDGIPFLTVVAPTKLSVEEAQMPAGVEDYGNAIGDAFLSTVEAGGTAALDLRETFAQLGDYSGYFFTTDHHWKPEGALFACGVLMEFLEREYGFSVQWEALLEENYKATVYEGLFLGSQGKRVGSLYAGLDDFTVFTPLFETSFTYLIPERSLERTGTFNEALCFSERLEETDYFTSNPYTYYSGGDWGKAIMVNNLLPDGVRVVLIRDSFSCALAPFLALQCGELITIDLRYYTDDLYAEIQELQPDYVIMLYAASSCRSPAMFQLSSS
ncbi:MAG: hypothetical protein LUD69_08915 [Oscillospiraceae bacterium]|nr:hypothetical protein [Oscillospiraceae bacterium]